jgi:hypothetical protein
VSPSSSDTSAPTSFPDILSYFSSSYSTSVDPADAHSGSGSGSGSGSKGVTAVEVGVGVGVGVEGSQSPKSSRSVMGEISGKEKANIIETAVPYSAADKSTKIVVADDANVQQVLTKTPERKVRTALYCIVPHCVVQCCIVAALHERLCRMISYRRVRYYTILNYTSPPHFYRTVPYRALW